MIVMFKSTPLPPTRFVFLIIDSYLTHRPSLDMVSPVKGKIVNFQMESVIRTGGKLCLLIAKRNANAKTMNSLA